MLAILIGLYLDNKPVCKLQTTTVRKGNKFRYISFIVDISALPLLISYLNNYYLSLTTRSHSIAIKKDTIGYRPILLPPRLLPNPNSAC